MKKHSMIPAWMTSLSLGACSLMLVLCCMPTNASAVSAHTLMIDDVGSGLPSITLDGSAFAGPILPGAGPESFIINLNIDLAQGFTPTSVILDEPGHTATSDELAVNDGNGGTKYQVFFASVPGEAGLGFPPNPNNPVETFAWQTLYSDPQLEIQVRSDMPDAGSSAVLMLLSLGALAGITRRREIRAN